MSKSFARLFSRIFVYPWPIQSHPLIQCFSDHATAELIYNTLISVKANPLLCEQKYAFEEALPITKGVYLNLGHHTPGSEHLHEEVVALANRSHTPIVVDLVGVATLASRQNFASQLSFNTPSIIKGNYSEMLKYCELAEHLRGFHSPRADQTREKQDLLVKALTKKAKASPHTTFVVTGEIDIVVDAHYAIALENGSDWLKNFAGGGSAVGAIISALMAEGLKPLQAALLAISFFNRCGEIARANLKEDEGYLIFRLHTLDQLSIIRDHPDWPTAIKGHIISQQ